MFIISVVRHATESPVKSLIQVVSVGTQHVSLDTQLSLLVFVVTLDVAVGTQLKQLCVVDIQQRVSGYTEDCNS